MSLELRRAPRAAAVAVAVAAAAAVLSSASSSSEKEEENGDGEPLDHLVKYALAHVSNCCLPNHLFAMPSSPSSSSLLRPSR